jgi:hypothetical protein
MSGVPFYVEIVKTMDDIGAPYMIVGAFGGFAFGISRVTYDIDIIVDLREQDFDTLSQRFPLPRYYADPEMMRNSTEMGIMFNIIDTGEGVKADLVPLRREPEHRLAFERRVRRQFTAPSGEDFEAWVAQPTDIIIGKLYAWNEGRSNKHPNDIYSMLAFDLSGFSDSQIDYELISAKAFSIGEETRKMWEQLLERAKEELKKHGK